MERGSEIKRKEREEKRRRKGGIKRAIIRNTIVLTEPSEKRNCHEGKSNRETTTETQRERERERERDVCRKTQTDRRTDSQ